MAERLNETQRAQYAQRLSDNKLVWEILDSMEGDCWTKFKQSTTPDERNEIHAEVNTIASLRNRLRNEITVARKLQSRTGQT